MRVERLAAYVPVDAWSNLRVAARSRLERMRPRAPRAASGERTLADAEAKRFETSDRRVRRFIGFEQRRFCKEGEGTADLSTRVSRLLFERSGPAPDEVDAS